MLLELEFADAESLSEAVTCEDSLQRSYFWYRRMEHRDRRRRGKLVGARWVTDRIVVPESCFTEPQWRVAIGVDSSADCNAKLHKLNSSCNGALDLGTRYTLVVLGFTNATLCGKYVLTDFSTTNAHQDVELYMIRFRRVLIAVSSISFFGGMLGFLITHENALLRFRRRMQFRDRVCALSNDPVFHFRHPMWLSSFLDEFEGLVENNYNLMRHQFKQLCGRERTDDGIEFPKFPVFRAYREGIAASEVAPFDHTLVSLDDSSGQLELPTAMQAITQIKSTMFINASYILVSLKSKFQCISALCKV